MAKCLQCGNDKKFYISMSELVDVAVLEYKEGNDTELTLPDWSRSDIRIYFKACVNCGSNIIRTSDDERFYSTFVVPRQNKRKRKKDPRPNNVFEFVRE